MKLYKSAELSIVRIAAKDIIATSPKMSGESSSIVDFGSGSVTTLDGAFGSGED